MGILNITPDSFSDGGRFSNVDAAIAQAEKMIAEGADILDIGGESTRPGAEAVAEAEQMRRVLPVIEALRQRSNITLSIDTTSSRVAQAALQVGANWINDVSAGLNDAAMLPLAAATGVPIILMHCQGTPKTMQLAPHYDDVITAVLVFLQQRITVALQAGIVREQLILDVGIGFGKRKQDNLLLLAHLASFVALGLPVLLGTSRKRFMGSICNINQPEELVTATAVTTALGVMAGVQLFRVHDVQANRQAADVAWAILHTPHFVAGL
jgi:dihydropteroate synthase